MMDRRHSFERVTVTIILGFGQIEFESIICFMVAHRIGPRYLETVNDAFRELLGNSTRQRWCDHSEFRLCSIMM